MKRKIVFVQASRDVGYALALFGNSSAETEFVVIEHEHNYNVVKDFLGIHGKVSLIESKKVTGPVSAILVRCQLNDIYHRNFSTIKDYDVYFFCNYFDFRTFYFLSKLKLNNRVFMYDHYDLKKDVERIPSVYSLIKKLLYWIATRISFRLSKIEKCIIYDIEDIEIISLKSDSVVVKPVIKPKVLDKSVLFFDSNEQSNASYLNYSSVVKKIMDTLIENGFSIYIKPHPRLGMSTLFNEYPIEKIDGNFPIEMICTDSFDIAIGNVSAALAGCNPKNSIISIINLLECDDKIDKRRYIHYLKNLSSRIKFIEHQDNILNYVNENHI